MRARKAGLTLSFALWDAITRGSKHAISVPEAEPTCSWIHPLLQGLDKFIYLFRDHHTTVRHQTMVQAITSLGSVFTEDAVAQARRQRDDAIERRKKIKAAKSLVDVELEKKASSLKKAEADLGKVRAELSCADIEIGRLMVAAEDRASRAKQEMLKRLDDIEYRTKKLEEDAATMAKKQAVATSGEND